jgi:prepilin-type N-terminal cleavage/methylation domain
MILISNHSSKGFTLIEVLVVLIIAGAATSLVAPNLFNAYEGIKASAEEQKMFDVIETVKMRAFLRKLPYTVTFVDNILRVKDEKVRVEFDFIQFTGCSIIFNRNGFPDIREIKYLIMGENRIFDASS